MSITPISTNATHLTHSTWASAELKHGWAWIPRLAHFVLHSLARHSCLSCMDALHDTTCVRSHDPEPYDATTSQDNLLPTYQQEARCLWTSIARNCEIVAQHGWIKTIPISTWLTTWGHVRACVVTCIKPPTFSEMGEAVMMEKGLKAHTQII